MLAPSKNQAVRAVGSENRLPIIEIEHEFCTHALIDQAEGIRVRVIAASEQWPPEAVAERIEEAAKAGEREV